MPGPDLSFWQDHFVRGVTPWDRGEANPQLEQWLEERALNPVDLGGPIAVPGCGSGHEVVALARRGFDVLAIDYAPAACTATQARLDAQGARARVVCADVLSWMPEAPVAAIYEQTCLCALHPDDWTRYAQALHAWLRPGGLLLLLAMQVPRPGAAVGLIEGPPYHVDVNALRALFDGRRWLWQKPPYARVPHPNGSNELALVLTRR
jgi:SAM-dependent methyltransferase